MGKQYLVLDWAVMLSLPARNAEPSQVACKTQYTWHTDCSPMVIAALMPTWSVSNIRLLQLHVYDIAPAHVPGVSSLLNYVLCVYAVLLT